MRLPTIIFDNGTTASILLSDMAGIIPSPLVRDNVSDKSQPLLPPFLPLNSKITHDHDGQFHREYLGLQNRVYWLIFKSHMNTHKEDWGVDLPDLSHTWVDLCVESVLVPGHVAHSFLCMPSSNSLFDPIAFFVSAINLHQGCPPLLLKALATMHTDQEVWLQSYYKEKQGIESLATYCKITLGEYRALREKDAPKAIPTLCVLTIKKDENFLWVDVLCNHEDCIWSKLDWFAPGSNSTHRGISVFDWKYWLACNVYLS
jgi:hypothetical protein